MAPKRLPWKHKLQCRFTPNTLGDFLRIKQREEDLEEIKQFVEEKLELYKNSGDLVIEALVALYDKNTYPQALPEPQKIETVDKNEPVTSKRSDLADRAIISFED